MNILVTAIGTMAGTTVIRMLKKNKNISVFGADINEKDLIYASREVDNYVQFPSVINNDDYLNYILDFCKKNKIDFIVPIIDEEVDLLTSNNNMFELIGTKILSPGIKTVKMCRDKLATFEYVKQNFPEIYVETLLLKDYDNQFDLPAFVKPNKGRSSINCCKVVNKIDLDYYKNKNDVLSELIIQPFCKGEIVSVDLVRCSKTKQVKAAIRKELLRNSNGSAIAVKFIKDDKLESICVSIANAIDVDGVVNFEFFVNGQDYKLIEINPRFPAGTEYTCLAGIDLVNECLRIKQGKPISECEVEIGKECVRRYETYECN